MNKAIALKAVSIGLKVVSVVTGLAAYNDLVPAKYAVVAAFVFGLASILKDAFTSVGDLLDDGMRNDSFKG